jgi:UDP-4-amino-4,6-dideoxy-N-acetyl-beta-L-altrosamine N-acetyltransferase
MSEIPGGPRIRAMLHTDLERVLRWRNHPEVRRYMYTQQEISLDEHRKWFERTLQDKKKHLLIYESGGEPLGFLNIGELARGHIADWGFYVAPDAPKGTGRQLGTAGVRHAFEDLQLHKLCGQALAFNERSVRFHQSLGFRQEGVLRDQHFDGERYHDVVCFGLLRHEWHPCTEKN